MLNDHKKYTICNGQRSEKYEIGNALKEENA